MKTITCATDGCTNQSFYERCVACLVKDKVIVVKSNKPQR